ncbi:hypothetical protein CJ195_09400 [Bacillus sp. UMB0899]|uniref:lysozyme inhibitor LprI family protein n=1 Tax=Metabacillus schmidteae TaxID=2730405 RepID=UPI000C7FF17E|nr:lysozyme inhibitor LprI family protein [Metabacillus schmidteae]PMC38657.1 hypothetical protein CJ195_09400 [Bacillus sp. UMB0899]
MNTNRKFSILIGTVLLGLLTACGDSSTESNAKPSENNTSQNENVDSNTIDVPEENEEAAQYPSESTKNNEQNEQEKNSNSTSTSSNDVETSKSGNNNKMTESKKGEYLKKLNKMEEADRYAEVKTTMVEMEEQEEERYKKWDKELNEIYGVLKEKLDAEQMEKLREEQRNWIKERDEVAKASSLKYEGGSTESLEYVATQASLTRERCYELVAKYMK